MKTDEVELERNSLHGEMEKSFFWNGKLLALIMASPFHVILWNVYFQAKLNPTRQCYTK